MRKSKGSIVAIATAIGFNAMVAFSSGGSAQDAQATYKDIEQTLGSVPSFFKAFPEVAIAGAWAETYFIESPELVVEIGSQHGKLLLRNGVGMLLVPNMRFVRKPDTVLV